jgi:hypothetical protein
MSSGEKVYNVQSSEVSGLIGRNKYCPREQAMLKFIKRMNYNNFKHILRVINVREVYVIANELLSESGNIKDKFTEAIRASNTNELQDKLEELYKEIEKTNYYKTKKKITNRNEEMIEKVVKRFPEYTIMLRSKIDGIDRANNCLIEHKNRVYELFNEIPDHEQVQLEIYMRVTGLSKCKLVQTHFNEVSEIDFVPTTQGWKEIKTKLIATMIEIHDLLENEIKLKTFISKYRKYL